MSPLGMEVWVLLEIPKTSRRWLNIARFVNQTIEKITDVEPDSQPASCQEEALRTVRRRVTNRFPAYFKNASLVLRHSLRLYIHFRHGKIRERIRKESLGYAEPTLQPEYTRGGNTYERYSTGSTSWRGSSPPEDNPESESDRPQGSTRSTGSESEATSSSSYSGADPSLAHHEPEDEGRDPILNFLENCLPPLTHLHHGLFNIGCVDHRDLKAMASLDQDGLDDMFIEVAMTGHIMKGEDMVYLRANLKRLRKD